MARGSLCELLEPPEPLEELLEELLEEAACAGEPSDTAMISGPLTPGPKYFESRSYAWRAVVMRCA